MTLNQHSRDVRQTVQDFGRALGLGDRWVSDLGLAAWLHDVGKADPRFQRWLTGGSEIEAVLLEAPLAKSALPPASAAERELARRRAGYPRGYRHELLSLAMIEGAAAALSEAHDPDLVKHLVASHHGWCRPFAPSTDDSQDFGVELQHGAHRLEARVRHGKARMDAGVADRFWRLTDEYGWWGLAWLEAILRLADHRASEGETEGAS